MSFDAPHVSYVLFSYGLSFAVMIGLVIGYVMRSRRIKTRLERLEATGAPRRRSSAGAGQ
jgi:heme exporter protein CcmD